MVTDILRLPLRAVVASNSATRSSRSAQQFPPRSAADAELIFSVSPAAARMAMGLVAFINAPFICISNELSCVDAGSSTRMPGVCPVSGPRRTHARVRRRREPDAKRVERNAYNADTGGTL